MARNLLIIEVSTIFFDSLIGTVEWSISNHRISLDTKHSHINETIGDREDATRHKIVGMVEEKLEDLEIENLK